MNLIITVLGGNGPTLLGQDWLQHLRLDWVTLNHITQTESCELEKLLSDYSDLISEGVGEIKGIKVKLYLRESGKPRFFCARQVPYYAIRDQVAKEIDRQVNLGILEPVKFSHWGIPVVLSRRKMDPFVCAVIYKITVNRETITETYPLPSTHVLAQWCSIFKVVLKACLPTSSLG